jgi:hypothetical protein
MSGSTSERWHLRSSMAWSNLARVLTGPAGSSLTSDGALFIAMQGSLFLGSDQWGECTNEENRMTLVFCTNEGS